jgi:agmatinase
MTQERRARHPGKTAALFFPFDLFGSAGAGRGAELLADAVREMLDDNRRERQQTRARAYTRHVRMEEMDFKDLGAYQEWRDTGRKAVRRCLQGDEFLLWIAGNHLGALPLYEELGRGADDTLVIQFDAHLDIYHLSDCTPELSHGNFLLHAKGPLPKIVNVGSRELLLQPEYVARFYQRVFPTSEVAVAAERVARDIRTACETAKRVFLDIDCDVLDPGSFPAVTNPVPFGVNGETLLRLLEAAWSPKVIGMALSEFDPGRDVNDRCLALLIWLIEFVLLKRYEGASAPTK